MVFPLQPVLRTPTLVNSHVFMHVSSVTESLNCEISVKTHKRLVHPELQRPPVANINGKMNTGMYTDGLLHSHRLIFLLSCSLQLIHIYILKRDFKKSCK